MRGTGGLRPHDADGLTISRFVLLIGYFLPKRVLVRTPSDRSRSMNPVRFAGAPCAAKYSRAQATIDRRASIARRFLGGVIRASNARITLCRLCGTGERLP